MKRNEIIEMMAAGQVKEALDALCKMPALLKERDEHGNALVHSLVASGDIRHCLDLVTPDLVELVGLRGWTTMHYAAAANTVGLLADKTSGRVRLWADDHGDLPAHIGARQGTLSGFPRLTPIELSHRNNLGQTPLHLAAQYEHLDQIKANFSSTLLLSKDIGGRTPLSIAEETGAIAQLPASLVAMAQLLTGKQK
jgi:hypothetical protein